MLFFLHGDTYRLTFMLLMAACVMTLIWRLRQTEAGDLRQQIKWALFGFSGYALFLSLALAIDMSKLTVGSFATQIVLEIVGGLSFGLAFLCLNLGLLIALMRFRLYDAEAVIGRSANFALITLALGGIFAATNEAVKVFVQNLYGPPRARRRVFSRPPLNRPRQSRARANLGLVRGRFSATSWCCATIYPSAFATCARPRPCRSCSTNPVPHRKGRAH